MLTEEGLGMVGRYVGTRRSGGRLPWLLRLDLMDGERVVRTWLTRRRTYLRGGEFVYHTTEPLRVSGWRWRARGTVISTECSPVNLGPDDVLTITHDGVKLSR